MGSPKTVSGESISRGRPDCGSLTCGDATGKGKFGDPAAKVAADAGNEPADHPEHLLQLVASGDITLPDLDLCWCCNGILGRPRKRAVYWWRTQRGYWLGLCTRCCAIWRQDAASEPFLQSVCVTNRRPATEAA